MSPPRINIRGTSGSGKSTLSAQVALALGIRHIELDALHHGPNWAEPTNDEFRARVRSAMGAAERGWVVDGNYDRKLGTLVTDAADTVVWLDPPFPLVFGRMLRRTLHRIRHDVELWNGNRESWQAALVGRDALVWWTLRSHFRHRRDWPALLATHPGYVHLRSDRAARAWLAHTLATRQPP
jgi:adenylate kinase family enzyme